MFRVLLLFFNILYHICNNFITNFFRLSHFDVDFSLLMGYDVKDDSMNKGVVLYDHYAEKTD